jgi:hypothetical protein
MAATTKVTKKKLTEEQKASRKLAKHEGLKEELRSIAVGNDKLRVFGLEKLATTLHTRESTIKDLNEKQTQDKTKLIERVAVSRANEEQRGNFYKTCLVHAGPDQDDIQVIWTDSYSALPTKHEPILRKAFGKRFEDMFVRVAEVKPRSPMSAATLRERMGDKAYEIFADLFEVKEAFKVKAGFMETRFRKRAELDAETNELLDIVQAGAQAKPTVKKL